MYVAISANIGAQSYKAFLTLIKLRSTAYTIDLTSYLIGFQQLLHQQTAAVGDYVLALLVNFKALIHKLKIIHLVQDHQRSLNIQSKAAIKLVNQNILTDSLNNLLVLNNPYPTGRSLLNLNPDRNQWLTYIQTSLQFVTASATGLKYRFYNAHRHNFISNSSNRLTQYNSQQ